MEKRLLIAFALSFVVLYAFQYIYPTRPVSDTVVSEKETPVSSAPPQETPTEKNTVESAIAEPVVRAETPAQRKVETDLYEATLSNVGGVLLSFRLNNHLDEEGRPVELIDPYAGSQVGYPLATETNDPSLDDILANAKFAIKDGAVRNELVLEYRENGIYAKKTLIFDPTKYLVSITSTITRNGSAVPHQITIQGDFGDHSIPLQTGRRFAIYQVSQSFKRQALTGISDPQEVTAAMVGVEDTYFLAMFLSQGERPVKVSKADYKLANLPDGTEGTATRALHVAMDAGMPLQLYIGPKSEQSLAQANPALSAVIDYGMFAIIAKPCLVALLWLHGYIGNYGWAIIVLTFLINMILFPLRVKQQLSAQKMQKMAPQMRQLQDKYKKLKPGDPKRAEVERELMEINKQQLGGCLPMLLQMPFLFAFLAMMNNAIELRGAPWILWVQDLSQPDHFYILPVLMGVAMFVQMKLGPTSPDPAQARMMMITPILVTILFLWFQSASGLTLYWLTGNVIGIGQQWFIRNYWTDDGSKPSRKQLSPA